jgi:hypothetical protein
MSGNDFRSEQELSELARLLPVPAARDLPAGRHQILKEHLMTELHRMEPEDRPLATGPRKKRPHGMFVVAGAGVLAAAVAATVIIAGHVTSAHPGVSPQTSGPATGGGSAPSSPAAVLLARIANAAASQPAPTVRDSEFMYIRSEVAYEQDAIVNGHETATMEKPHERQVWLPVANICVTGLLREGGSSTPLSPFPVVNGKVQPPSSANSGGLQLNFTCPSEGHLGDASYRLLQSLPTNPQALLNYLKAGKKYTNDDPLMEIGDMIKEAIIPPAVAAALYRVAALLPGATVVPDAVNAVGQHGIAIAWAPTNGAHTYRNEWIFDKKTLQYIGERDYNVKTGVVNGESAILQRGFVNKPGELP